MAVFVHLDDTDQSNGGLGVFPGSHLQGPQVEKREKNSSRNQQILLLLITFTAGFRLDYFGSMDRS